MATAKQVKKPRKSPRKKVEQASRGLAAAEVGAGQAVPLAELIRADGGTVIGTYQEPLGGHPVVVAALPLNLVEPTPYQRDRSPAHVKKLADAFERVGYFLDPVIAVRREGKYYTPNGNHRLGAAALAGMKTIIALVLPDAQVEFKILALNTEKAHNLKERSLEVIRMARGMTGSPGNESDYLSVFEEPHFLTFGAVYEQRPRYSAGAYAPVVKRLEGFLELPIAEALAVREARAQTLLAWDDEVVKVVDALKEKGLTSPYLKNFVVARVNFLRFKKGGDFDFDQTLETLRASTRKIDPAKVDQKALATMAGAPAEAADE
jgi:ParB family transcriptional regulator, chromosome partitioning protein